MKFFSFLKSTISSTMFHIGTNSSFFLIVFEMHFFITTTKEQNIQTQILCPKGKRKEENINVC
jgi:hypothetical protein